MPKQTGLISSSQVIQLMPTWINDGDNDDDGVSKGLFLIVKDRLYNAYVRTTMLHGSESWAVTAEDMCSVITPTLNRLLIVFIDVQVFIQKIMNFLHQLLVF